MARLPSSLGEARGVGPPRMGGIGLARCAGERLLPPVALP